MAELINDFKDLRVYQNAKEVAMEIFRLTKSYPKEEMFSMTDQVRRSSRSICSNVAEAWGKRRYKKAFISKLSDAESEAYESIVWLDFSDSCGYLEKSKAEELEKKYRKIIGQVINMIRTAEKWTLKQ